MRTIDFIVIYLACGAPLAVYRLTSSQTFSLREKLLRPLLDCLLWPLLLSFELIKRFRTATESRNSVKAADLHRLMDEIESLIFDQNSTPSTVFQFRSVAERFAGLGQAVAASADRIQHEVPRITEHPDRDLADICLGRRDAAKIRHQFSLALCDFAALIEQHMMSATSPERLLELSFDIADLVDSRSALEIQIAQNRTLERSTRAMARVRAAA